MRNIYSRLINIIFPVRCAACGKILPFDDIYRVCDECLKSIKRISDGLYCKTCGISLPDGGAHCYQCLKAKPVHFECIRSAAKYEGVLRGLILKFKYNSMDYLSKIFGVLLIEAVNSYPDFKDFDLILAVPMHWLKKMQRGYNQSELLAEIIASHFKKPLISKYFKRKKFTTPQFKLNRQNRRKNLENCFEFIMPPIIKHKTILLVDDICTSKQTIDQCALALKNVGAKKVLALTLARD
jgi:competence protein ComFC